MNITVFTIIAVLALFVAMANQLPKHWQNICPICKGHEHSPDCPWADE